MDIPQNKEITYFAKTDYRDNEKKFGIKRKDRRQHMYVLGKSGTGKSVMMKNMAIQNIANGEGCAVVDPHGELVEELLEMIPPERKNDVVYFNPSDTDYFMGFNVMEVPDPKYIHLVASGLMGIFTKIWANVWSSRMEYILNNAILALLETPGSTMLGIPRLLVDQDYRQAVLANVNDPVVRSFWITEYESWQERFRNEAIAPIQNKVGQFLSSAITRNVVGQAKSTFDIFDIMNNKKILLVNVSKGRVGEDNSALLGAMLITKIQLAAMERVRIPEDERKDFYLYVDEFQNFVTDSFASILSEARKYRLNLILAHQYINQLIANDSTMVRDAVFGNVGTMVVFRVGATDAEFLEKEFEPEFTPQDFVNQPNYHAYLKLMIDGVTSRPFSAKTLPPFKVTGSEMVAREIIEHSRRIYAKPRAEVENEIESWSRSKPGDESAPDANSDPSEVKPSKDGKYRIKCSLFEECGNVAEVPFKPEKNRPVYCKVHIEKIKTGETKPVSNFSGERRPNKQLQTSMDALSSMGIGFKPAETKKAFKFEKKEKFEKFEKKEFKKELPKEFKKEERPKVAFQKKETNEAPKTKINLRNILSDVLGKEMKEEKKEERVVEKPTEIKQEPKTISLSSLNQAPKVISEIEKPMFVKNQTRMASTTSMDDLKTTLQKAVETQKPEASKIPTPEPPKAPEIKKPEPIKEVPKVIIEEKVKEEIKEEIVEEKIRQDKITHQPAPSNTPKEVPEDILRRVLE